MKSGGERAAVMFHLTRNIFMPVKTAVIAIGGNSLIPDNEHREMSYQWDAVRETCGHIACMIQEGWRVVITHGNGPQVGYILRRAELAAQSRGDCPFSGT